MPPRDPAVYLEDIEHYAGAAARFVQGVSLEQYRANEEKRAAVERVLEIAGEALTKLAQTAPEVAEQIPSYRKIIGLRNILAHGYAQVDDVQVFEAASLKVPELLVAVRKLLQTPT